MNENEFFNNLKRNKLKDLIFDSNYNNHLDCFYNTIEFDKYYTNLVIHINKNNLYDMRQILLYFMIFYPLSYEFWKYFQNDLKTHTWAIFG